jgi:hypothetical protein
MALGTVLWRLDVFFEVKTDKVDVLYAIECRAKTVDQSIYISSQSVSGVLRGNLSN